MVKSLLMGGVAVATLLTSFALASADPLPDLGPRVILGHIVDGAGTTIVRPLSGAPVAAVELWYRAPSSGFEATPQTSLGRLAAQTVASSKPLVGKSLGDVVRDAGGQLQITAYGDSASISALVPAAAARSVAHAMTLSYFSPVVTEDGFKTALRDVATDAIYAGFDPDLILRDVLFGSLFASGPQHYPALGSAKDVAAISLDSVRAFATRAFRVQNAVLVSSGAVDTSVFDDISKGRQPAAAGDTAEKPEPSQVVASPEPVTKTFEEPAAGYAWTGPPISDERAATAMDFIADYLFRPGSGSVSRELAKSDPGAVVNAQFITLRNPGVMFVALSGGDVAKQRAAVEGAVSALRTPLGAAEFAKARDAFEYHLLSNVQTASEMADNFGWYAVEGNLAYAPGATGNAGAYYKASESLTPDFVAHIATQYLNKPAATASLAPAKPATTGETKS